MWIIRYGDTADFETSPNPLKIQLSGPTTGKRSSELASLGTAYLEDMGRHAAITGHWFQGIGDTTQQVSHA